jgi:NAD-dependent dihydropyrimidine dehydrogenase PreA subunit
MTYIIAEPCINVKDTACVDVCPVDCIHPRMDEAGFSEAVQLYINPDECIDCGACEPACPVTAIFPEEEVPEEWKQYIQINYDHWKK